LNNLRVEIFSRIVLGEGRMILKRGKMHFTAEAPGSKVSAKFLNAENP